MKSKKKLEKEKKQKQLYIYIHIYVHLISVKTHFVILLSKKTKKEKGINFVVSSQIPMSVRDPCGQASGL